MPEAIFIEETRKTPEVNLDPKGSLHFEGRSIPEDASLFYDRIIEWIHEYIPVANNTTTIHIALEYLNSGTSKYMLQILKLLKDPPRNDHKLIVNWYYEEGDDDILERGEYYESILGIKINYIETE